MSRSFVCFALRSFVPYVFTYAVCMYVCMYVCNAFSCRHNGVGKLEMQLDLELEVGRQTDC